MPRIRANGLELEYETFGDPHHPPLLLIMGFRTQMIGWDEELCEQLAAAHFYVLRFDNRDVGLSSKIEGGPVPNVGAAMKGDLSSASYTLAEMADDAVALLEALGLPAAHVVGASMGGMIAQLVAIRHPGRALSLCSIMSTTGDPAVGQPTPAAMSSLFSPVAVDREGFIAGCLATWKVLRSPGFPWDEPRLRARAGRGYDRCFYPPGAARQFVAVLASPDRTRALGALTLPTVVIHGAEDPLVTPSGGEATARAVPGAELLIIPGMGHDLPAEVWPRVVAAISANAARAKARPAPVVAAGLDGPTRPEVQRS